ncbi:MAG: efflux transporter outer membrane subunit, partial [Pseudomonadota bacterium]
GCIRLGPDHERPEPPLPADITTLPAAPELATFDVDERWWQRFEDPLLNALVQEAVTRNFDVAAAVARIRQARALRGVARGQGLPFLDADAAGSRQRGSTNAGGFGPPPGVPVEQSIFDLGLSASWELDVFGRIARRVEAADARIEVAEEDRNGILLMVVADTVQNYAELRAAQAQRAIARENVNSTSRTLELTTLLVEQELSPQFDLVRARAELNAVQAEVFPFEAQIRANSAALAELTGRLPTEIIGRLIDPEPLPPIEGVLPTGLPSELLRRRPDIRLAERTLAAETADVGAEIADLYPRFNLMGMFGFSALSLDLLFDSGSDTFSFGGAVNWPIFNGGQLRAEIEEARAGREEARALYSAAVLGAFRDVDEALTAYVFADRERTVLAETVADRERALELARLRFEQGLDSLIVLLETQRQLTAARSALAASDRTLLVATVGVYRALGGGWQAALAERKMAENEVEERVASE